MKGPYDDIIHLPHHVSPKRPPMPMEDRAAQFSPFAALTGYDSTIRETARLTDRKIELSDDAKAVLDAKIAWIRSQLSARPTVTIVYFVPDGSKEGGAYRTLTGQVKQIRDLERVLVLTDGTKISFEDILDLQGEHLPDTQDSYEPLTDYLTKADAFT